MFVFAAIVIALSRVKSMEMAKKWLKIEVLMMLLPLVDGEMGNEWIGEWRFYWSVFGSLIKSLSIKERDYYDLVKFRKS